MARDSATHRTSVASGAGSGPTWGDLLHKMEAIPAPNPTGASLKGCLAGSGREGRGTEWVRAALAPASPPCGVRAWGVAGDAVPRRPQKKGIRSVNTVGGGGGRCQGQPVGQGWRQTKKSGAKDCVTPNRAKTKNNEEWIQD